MIVIQLLLSTQVSPALRVLLNELRLISQILFCFPNKIWMKLRSPKSDNKHDVFIAEKIILLADLVVGVSICPSVCLSPCLSVFVLPVYPSFHCIYFSLRIFIIHYHVQFPTVRIVPLSSLLKLDQHSLGLYEIRKARPATRTAAFTVFFCRGHVAL